MADPVQDIPRYPTGQFVELRWASDAGTQVEPTSGNKDIGWSSAEIVTRQKLNWLNGKPMEFIMALISRMPNASEVAFSLGVGSEDASSAGAREQGPSTSASANKRIPSLIIIAEG
jgi:hypothetical protein